ncbi:MAG TPA: hypothetical protein VEX86_19860 [Longimicrobium sp.]|nr:hypothetical protein [Longimicrobium sp.]
MSDFYTPPPPPPPPHGGGGPNPPPPPPPGGGFGGGYQQGGPYGPGQGGPYQGGPGYRETPGGPGYPGPGGPGYPGGPPPKKRGMLPWILGCGGCGLLLLIALAVFGGIGYIASLGERAGGDADTTVVAGDEAGTLYTGTEEGLNANLRSMFVPFSFRYPDGWAVVERGDAEDAMNFVKVERSNGGTTAENFAVGYLQLPPGREDDRELLGQLLSQLEQQFTQQFAGFQRVGDDRMTLDGRQATGFRFTGQQGEVKIFGRVLLLPVGDGRGLSIIMLGTPVGSGLSSLDDLGEKGGLPVILRSFRVGESAEGAGGTPAEGTDGAAAGTTGDDAAAEPAPSDDAQVTDDAPTDDAPVEGAEPDIQEIKPIKP